MPIEGSLREFALQDIFQLLHLSRKTGELKVVREPSGLRGAVIFSGGAVVDSDVDEETPRLGYMLLNAGKITEADLQHAGRVHSMDARRSWTDIFSSLGILDQEDLEEYAKFQVEEFVYEVLSWQDGRFSFGERPVAESERVTWIPVESLLMEGARRADELSALPTTIDSPNAVPRLSEKAATDGGMLDLSPQDWEVIGRVDGVTDVKSLAWTLGRSEFEVSKVISLLVQKGLIELQSQEDARTKPPHVMALDRVEREIEAGELDVARRHIDSVLRAHPEEPRAHLLAARILEHSRDLRAAAECYEKTLSFDPLAEEARQRLGLLKLRLGDVDGAAREWTAYLRMAPNTPDRRRVERAMAAVRELQIILSEFDGREHP
jgi:hypothetical protein